MKTRREKCRIAGWILASQEVSSQITAVYTLFGFTPPHRAGMKIVTHRGGSVLSPVYLKTG